VVPGRARKEFLALVWLPWVPCTGDCCSRYSKKRVPCTCCCGFLVQGTVVPGTARRGFLAPVAVGSFNRRLRVLGAARRENLPEKFEKAPFLIFFSCFYNFTLPGMNNTVHTNPPPFPASFLPVTVNFLGDMCFYGFLLLHVPPSPPTVRKEEDQGPIF